MKTRIKTIRILVATAVLALAVVADRKSVV